MLRKTIFALVATALGTAALAPTVQPTWAQFQQQSKLVGTGGYSEGSVALSADGNTAIVGGYADNGGAAAAWVFTRSGGVWTQQGKVSADSVVATFPTPVALSANGNTAIMGNQWANGGDGAAWVFTRIGGVWPQQGSKLLGTGAVAFARQGSSVALSADGTTAIVGTQWDNEGNGAAWVFTRSGSVWTQQGSKLLGTGRVKSVALAFRRRQHRHTGRG
jgi:hypothetical protein